MNADSTLGKAADIVLALPQAREACPHNLAPTTSSLMQLALGDALAIALLESRGFTAIDFGVFHPRGKLGAALKFIRDVMHPGDAVPLIARGAPMSEAIVEMSAKGFGCVAVIDADGKLAGVITDGDLRRHMRDDLLQAPRRRSHDGVAENRPARSTGQRGAATPQFVEDHRAHRRRQRAGRSASCISTICCAPAWLFCCRSHPRRRGPGKPSRFEKAVFTRWIPAFAGIAESEI